MFSKVLKLVTFASTGYFRAPFESALSHPTPITASVSESVHSENLVSTILLTE